MLRRMDSKKRLPGRRFLRPHGFFAEKKGALVTVKNCANGYPLPIGLKEGDLVKVLDFDHGYYSVKRDGKVFSIFLTNVVRRRAGI
jgi:hypothetical protein